MFYLFLTQNIADKLTLFNLCYGTTLLVCRYMYICTCVISTFISSKKYVSTSALITCAFHSIVNITYKYNFIHIYTKSLISIYVQGILKDQNENSQSLPCILRFQILLESKCYIRVL